MKKSGEIVFVFLIGCFMYSLIEIAARGFTHWSMTLTGGICLLYIYHITGDKRLNVLGKCIAGAVFITAAELFVGYIVNIKCGWNVWDYSNMPANFKGQICLPFSVIWFFLCYAGYRICILIKRKFIKIYELDKIANEITMPIPVHRENL